MTRQKKEQHFRYLTPNGAKNILHYKYRGSDASLYYKHVISPAAQWLVDHVIGPSIAPNTITISGLGLVFLSHVALLISSPNMEDESPRWVYALAGFALLFYQVLDVADGKQARKTGNSSPLGLIFDHGCDAVNIVLSACNFATTVATGRTYWSLLLVLCPAMVFFMATWEEYYTGILALPPLNGPNEGLAIMYGLYFMTAYIGPGIWKEPNYLFPKVPNNQALIILIAVASIGQSLLSAIIALNELLNAKKSCFSAIVGLLPFVTLVVLSALWVLWSPSDIFHDHPRLIMWTVGLLFCKMVMHIMLAHMCEEPYRLLRKTFTTQLAIAALLVAGIVPWGHEKLVVEFFFLLTAIVYFHMVYYVVHELTSVLNIHVFKVKEKK